MCLGTQKGYLSLRYIPEVILLCECPLPYVEKSLQSKQLVECQKKYYKDNTCLKHVGK